MDKLRKNRKLIAGLVLVLAALSISYFLATSYFNNKDASRAENIQAKVAKLYLLPADEKPALITVVDVSKLSSKYLRQYAKNGDKILLYQKYGRVIIYRPSQNKIVDVGPLQLDDVKQSSQE